MLNIEAIIRRIRDNDQLDKLLEQFPKIVSQENSKKQGSQQVSLNEFQNLFVQIVQSLTAGFKKNMLDKQVANFLKNYSSFISQIKQQEIRDKLLRFMCSKSLTVFTNASEEMSRSEFRANALALAVLLKENQLNPEVIITTLLTNTDQNEIKKTAALIAISKIAEVFQLQLHAKLTPEKVQLIKQFVLNNDWDNTLFNEIDIITNAMKFNIQKPVLQPIGTLTQQIFYDNLVAITYDKYSRTLFTGGYDSKIIYWDCTTQIQCNQQQQQQQYYQTENIKNTIDFKDQQVVSIDFCEKSQILLGCTRCLGAEYKSPVLFGVDLNGQERFYLHSSSEALYVCKFVPGTDRCLTSETVSSGGKKSYVVKVYNVEQLGGTNNLGALPPENIIVGHSNRVSDVQVDEIEKNIILTTSFDRRAKLWDLRQPSSPILNLGYSLQNRGRSSSNERAHQSYVHSGDLNIQKNTVVTGGQDFVLKIWDIRNNLGPQSSYHLDDSAVIKVRLNKLGGIVSYGSMCAASTMTSFFTVNLQKEGREIPFKQVEQIVPTATRDFVWVKNGRDQFVYTTQNNGVVAKYGVGSL